MMRFSLALLGALLLFCGYTSGAMAQTDPEASPEGFGTIVDVHWPSQPKSKRFHVGNGDKVTGRYGWYRPPSDQNEPLEKSDYNVLVITKPISKARVYIIFEAINIDPEVLKKRLGRLEGIIDDVGTQEGALKVGDSVHITTQDYFGATRVILDVKRGDDKPVAQYSFLNHYRLDRTGENDPVLPYMPYVSEIE